MADFIIAQDKVKKAEGGYTDNPKDGGNWLDIKGSKTGSVKMVGGKPKSKLGGKPVLVGTNFGVAAPTLAAYLNRPITAAEMKAYRYEDALKLYKNSYWKPIGGDTINDQNVADLLYDSIVQHGAGGTGKILSKALGKTIRLPIDNQKASLINSVSGSELFNKIKDARLAYYETLPNYDTFGKGWLNRMEGLVYSGARAAASAVSENKGTTGAIGLFFLLGLATVYTLSGSVDKNKNGK